MIKTKKALLIFMCSVLPVLQGWAAPSVKMLGGNSLPGMGKVMTVKNDNMPNVGSSSVRASSVRAVKSANIKPVSDNKVAKDVNAARLSVGKYLHNAGVNAGKIKPINTSGSSISNTEIDRLDEEIVQLNAKITELTNQLTELNNRIGVDVAEKDTNADPEKFINKIEVDENGKTLRVSRSNVKIPVGSETNTPVASMWIEE